MTVIFSALAIAYDPVPVDAQPVSVGAQTEPVSCDRLVTLYCLFEPSGILASPFGVLAVPLRALSPPVGAPSVQVEARL